MTERYYGKYRGVVLNNIDPLQIGRLQVQVPDVANLVPLTWAMPCVPFAGKQMGWFAPPQIGAGVWVEFEQGNRDYPIWSGCWYGSAAEVPTLALATPAVLSSVTMQTTARSPFWCPGGTRVWFSPGTPDRRRPRVLQRRPHHCRHTSPCRHLTTAAPRKRAGHSRQPSGRKFPSFRPGATPMGTLSRGRLRRSRPRGESFAPTATARSSYAATVCAGRCAPGASCRPVAPGPSGCAG